MNDRSVPRAPGSPPSPQPSLLPSPLPSQLAPHTFACDGPARVEGHGIARIGVVGGESTGKSTLVAGLGERFREPSVAEYGRTLWEEQGGHVSYDDLRLIGHRHVTDENAATRIAKRCVFIDTTPLTTLWYSIDGYGQADPELVELSWRPYDLVLVCAPDFAFVQDGTRSSEDFRLRHDRWIRAILRARGADYVDVRGPVEARLAQVTALIAPLYASR